MRFRVAVLCGWVVAAGMSAQERLAEERELDDVVRCLVGLGLPDAVGRPFVRVTTGGGSRVGNQLPIVETIPGMLVADDGRRFTVVTATLQERAFTRRKQEGSTSAVGCEPIDLRTEVDALLAQQASYYGMDEVWYAWLAHGQGDRVRARRLLGRLVGCRWHTDKGRVDVVTAARATIAHFGYESIAACYSSFSEESGTVPSDTELLRRMDRWLGQFACDEIADGMRELRAAQADSLARTLPPDATEVQRLVHGLVQTRGSFQVDDGWPYVDPQQDPESSAAQLVALGVRAVPDLLAALDDRRPVRAVRNRWRGIGVSEVMRVGRVAQVVLGSIAGIDDAWEDTAAARATFEHWWTDVQARGERTVLVERAEAGGRDALRRLAELDGERAVAAARRGLEAVHESWQRADMLTILAIKCPAAALALLRERLDDADARVANAAAAAVLERPEVSATEGDRGRAITAMLRSWRGGDQKAGEQVARWGGAAALRELDERRQRFDDDLVAALGRRSDGQPVDDASEEQRERMLLALCEETREAFTGSSGGTFDPRIADYAGQALAERWPDRYRFDFALLRPDRDRQLIALRNVARRRADRPLLAEPAAVATGTVDDRLAELLARWRIEPVAAARVRLLASIEDHAALPVLRQLCTTQTGERRAELGAACSRLASVVGEVGPARVLESLPESLRERLAAMQGRPLDAEAIADVLAGVVADPPPTIGSFGIEVLRASGDAAVTLVVVRAHALGALRPSPQYRVAAAVGRRALLGSFGTGQREAVARRSHFDAFVAALQAAIEAPDGDAIEARYRVDLR